MRWTREGRVAIRGSTGSGWSRRGVEFLRGCSESDKTDVSPASRDRSIEEELLTLASSCVSFFGWTGLPAPADDFSPKDVPAFVKYVS